MSPTVLAPAPFSAAPPARVHAQRCACRHCGAHATGLVGRGTLGGSCGNCGSYELMPVTEVRPRSVP